MAASPLPLLFAATGSVVEEVQEALFVRLPLDGAATVRLKLAADPLVRLAMAGQVTVPALATPPPVALTNVAPVGMVSATITLAAVEGPRLVTVMV